VIVILSDRKKMSFLESLIYNYIKIMNVI
jgi:hypothetical protein